MYCVANNNGDLIAHDIKSKEKAEIICEAMNLEEPNEGWEIIEYGLE